MIKILSGDEALSFSKEAGTTLLAEPMIRETEKSLLMVIKVLATKGKKFLSLIMILIVFLESSPYN